MSFINNSTIELPKLENRLCVDLNYSKTCDYTLPEFNININEYNNLVSFKDKIDKIENHKLWDKAKKLSNDYELIHLPNKKIRTESIASYEPLSRSYFKLWEIIKDFNLLNSKDNNEEKMTMVGIAEGPGGFIEAFINYRKEHFNIEDDVFGITLKSINKDIPGWKKTADFLNKNPNVTISYGADGTGNIYNIENIKNFRELVGKNTANFITADGGFDFSIDFNKQEQLSYRLIFCEIVTALTVQKEGGTFICKVFDLYTFITISFIELLQSLYNCVYITKPLTSRPANSEKYIVATGFKGITESYLEELYLVVKKWDIVENINYNISSIFKGPINDKLIKSVNKYNEFNSKLQIENIVKTLDIIKKQSNLSLLNNIISGQSKKALEWCKKYDIKVNYNSNFLK